MKKRIGILTFHRSINYGAFMQAYSLSHYLARKFPDCVVEIIDYESKTMHEHYMPKISFMTFRHPVVSLKKRKQYDNFQSELNKLSLSKEHFEFDGNNESFTAYLKDHYDVVIVGSDAVWNWIKRGYPNPYVLDFNGPVRMSYAASAYGMDYLKQNEIDLSNFAKVLPRYRFVGVRDSYTADFISEITKGTVVPNINCDPTFFLDLKEVAKDAFTNAGDPLSELKKKYHIPYRKSVV